MTACSIPTDKQVHNIPKDSGSNFNSSINHTTKDSASTGAESELVQTPYLNTVERKEFYENGQLKKVGTATKQHDIYVGIWKFYSENGQLDSVINYDNKYKISYLNALKIAAQNDYYDPDVEVNLTKEKNKTFWEFTSWSENATQSGMTGKILLIDAETGTVTKPEYFRMSIY